MDGHKFRLILAVLLVVASTSAVSARPEEDPLSPAHQQAATFVVRAVANAGLFDPLGDYYHYTSIHESDGRLVASFIAMHCYRNTETETCDPVQGRSYYVTPDAWIELEDDSASFAITDVFGRFSEEAAADLMAYTEPSEVEEGHVEFPTVRLNDEGESFLALRAAMLWAGDLSTRPWSICLTTLINEDGTDVWQDDRGIAFRPHGTRDRSGGLFGSGVPKMEEATGARMACNTFIGETWRVRKGVRVERAGPHRVKVSAKMSWTLPMLVSGLNSRCNVQLFDEDGDLVRAMKVPGPPSPWTKSWLENGYIYGDARVSNPKTVHIATAYCHEA